MDRIEITKTRHTTPLMQQYDRIKEQHKDHILFFRLGDFYEMFDDDARKAAPVLEIALTQRQKIPMCGIPHHAANHYIAKLIKRGFCVALCEQIADESLPQNKSLFTRKVVHVITPGTLLEENLLSAKSNNYCASMCIKQHASVQEDGYMIGAAFTDISTGEFHCSEFTDTASFTNLSTLLSLHQPKEMIVSSTLNENKLLIQFLNNQKIFITLVDDGESGIPAHMMNDELRNKPLALSSCAILVQYIKQTRPQAINGLKNIRITASTDNLQLDETAVKNLELIEGLSSRSKENSLLEVLDYTLTAMGARALKSWILHPLLKSGEIIKRQKAISYFLDEPLLRAEVREKLKHICDLERTVNRLITGTANARDLNAIKNSLNAYEEIRKTIHAPRSGTIDNARLSPWCSSLDPVMEAVEKINATIVDSPPLSLREGGIIRPLYNAQLDEFREAVSHGKDWISQLEAKEREKTGINKLKIGYTSVFGYYIEVTKSNLDKIPADYHRKQTLTNAERFITPELKSMEDKILGAESKAYQLEYRLFLELRTNLLSYVKRMQHCAETTAAVDTLISLAEAAAHNDYNFPEISDEPGISIIEGRHPVIEKTVREEGGFIPNDSTLDASNSLWVITGPNMSGKSTFLRQTALIVLMAQMGAPVPARKARIGLIERIFTRIGASDNLSKGRSTFMVEMYETAHILKNLSSRSLLILDEIGRGTSTYDGISIAWAVIEFLHKKEPKPLVLFATHYFELTELAESLPTVTNYNVAVKEWQHTIIFLHKIVPGSADRSYGVHVAELAGLPKDIIVRAHTILNLLETNSHAHAPALQNNGRRNSQMSFFNGKHPIIEDLKNIDIDKLTPMAALQLLAEWKERA